MPVKQGLVYYAGIKAGVVSKTPAGYVFEYFPEYIALPGAKPVSLSFPLAIARFESAKLFPFFEGLLPEGWLLDITARSLKIEKDDAFELLLHVGGDTIGAVTIVPSGEKN